MARAWFLLLMLLMLLMAGCDAYPPTPQTDDKPQEQRPAG